MLGAGYVFPVSIQNIGNDRSNSPSAISAWLNAEGAGDAEGGLLVKEEEAAGAEAGAADAGENGGTVFGPPATAALVGADAPLVAVALHADFAPGKLVDRPFRRGLTTRNSH